MIRFRVAFPLVVGISLLWGVSAFGQGRESTPDAKSDTLSLHQSAAQTFQIAGDFENAEKENRAVLAIALARTGRIRLLLGELEKATELLERASAFDDPDSGLMTDLAIAFMRLGAFEKAVTSAKRAVDLDAGDARARHVLGKLLFRKANYKGALKHLERTVVLSSDLDALYTLGLTYLHLNELDRARLLFDELAQALKAPERVRILYGKALFDTDHPQEAEQVFRRALSTDPKSRGVSFLLGYLLLQNGGAGNLAEARKLFSAELGLTPDHFYANYFLGMLAANEQDFQSAIPYLTKAAAIRPEFGETYLYLGQSQAALDRPEAEKSLRKMIKLTERNERTIPRIKQARFLLGRLLASKGRKDESAVELQKARELQGKALESSRDQISKILARGATGADITLTGKNKTADNAGRVDGSGIATVSVERSGLGKKETDRLKEVYDRLAKIIARAFNNLGVIKAQRKDVQGSLRELEAAWQWDPGLEGLARNLGILAFRSRAYKKAIGPLSSHLKKTPGDALARTMLGTSLYLENDFAGAVSALSRLGDKVTSDAALGYFYGISLVRLGKQREADKVFAAISLRHAQVPQSRLYAAQGYMLTENFEAAIRELRDIARIAPKLKQVHYLAGQSLIRLNRMARAEAEFRKELVIDPSDEVAQYHLAYTLLEQKRKVEEAADLLKKAISKRFDYADARYQLGKLLNEQGRYREAIVHLEIAASSAPEKDYIRYQLSIAYRKASRTEEAERQMEVYRQLKKRQRNRPQSKPMGG